MTLHDLNVLHDGSDFSGPLRLHLQFAVPRFILRYHTLQEQILRINNVVETAELSIENQQETQGTLSEHHQRLVWLMFDLGPEHEGGAHDQFSEHTEPAEHSSHDYDEPPSEQHWEPHQGTEKVVPNEEVIGDISNLTNEYPENQELLESTFHDQNEYPEANRNNTGPEGEDATSDPLPEGVDLVASSGAIVYSGYAEQSELHPETEGVYDEAAPEPSSGEHPTVYNEDEYPEGSGTAAEDHLHSSDGFATLESLSSHESKRTYEDVEPHMDQGVLTFNHLARYLLNFR